MCPISYGCPPGYEPRTIELPLGANHFLNWLLNSFLNKLLGWGWGLIFRLLDYKDLKGLNRTQGIEGIKKDSLFDLWASTSGSV